MPNWPRQCECARFYGKPGTGHTSITLPYPVRRALVALIRSGSRATTAQKAAAIMDVNAGAVVAAFALHRVDRLIHGHTHRPARHDVVLGEREVQRWVLPDWYDAGGYLEIDARAATFRRVD